MKKLKVNSLNYSNIIVIMWTIYFVYTLILTLNNFSNKVHLTWQQAENQTNVYSSRRSSTVTYNFVKDNVRISREYPGLLEGINTWLWEIDKKKRNEDISFFIRSKDYKKIINNQIEHRKTIFGTQTNEIKPIPFFGLRTIDLKSNQFWLILDIWKYNYKWWIFILFIVLPELILIFFKRKGFLNQIEKQSKAKYSKIFDCLFWSSIFISIFNFII